MSAVSPGVPHIQQLKNPTSVQKLSHSEVAQALETFKLLIQSCYGPAGHLKTIQNSCGGPVTVTSTSSVLARQLSVSRPFLRLMLAGVEGHVATCSDSGLFCGLLMTNLIQSCRELDLHPVLCVDVNELMLKLCLDYMYLNSEDSCRVDVDVADSQTMLSLVRSVISTKPACGLSLRETDLICNLTLQAFLYGLPSSGPSISIPSLKFILIEGRTTIDSHILEGVLIKSPQIPPYASQVFNLPRQDDGSIRVALFNTSLAGGGEGFPDIHLETEEGVTIDAASQNNLLTLGSHLVQLGVGLLACQKVVHPCLKRFLRSHKILTIDRLSLVHIDAVQMVTGARPLGAVESTIPDDALGVIENMIHRVLFGKSYVHLQNRNYPVCTYVLCNRTESALEELKIACSAAHHVLTMTLSRPLALPGAGCFEACLATHLKHKIQSIQPDILDDLGCSRSQFRMVANNFIHCIELVARALEHGQNGQITDDVHHHRWLLPLTQNPSDWLGQCACGRKSFQAGSGWLLLGSRQQTSDLNHQSGDNSLGKQPIQMEKGKLQSSETHSPNTPVTCKSTPLVLDSYVAKLNALHVAVDTANVVLRIHQTIQESS